MVVVWTATVVAVCATVVGVDFTVGDGAIVLPAGASVVLVVIPPMSAPAMTSTSDPCVAAWGTGDGLGIGLTTVAGRLSWPLAIAFASGSYPAT